MTGSLSSHGRGPLTVTGFCKGQMRACVGVDVGLYELICADAREATATEYLQGKMGGWRYCFPAFFKL